MSIWIRRKYADWKGDVQCFTCYYIGNWKTVQAGHFRHKYLDFDELNIHPQCPLCNRWGHGRPKIYESRLKQKYGDNVIELIDKRVDKERQRIDQLGYAYAKPELESIIDDLTQKMATLT